MLTSLQRFNLGYERYRPTDRWVDYCISLESLYSKENTEVTNRLSTRAAKVLEDAILDNRITKKKQIMKWYGTRSNLVHGTYDPKRELKDLPILEEDLRKSIRWFISNKHWCDKAKIIDILDLCPQSN